MKRKYVFISLLFAWAVLTAMLIQSLHSFHHLEEEFSKEKCHHEHGNNKAELTHSHQNDHCFVCEFAFINSTTLPTFSFEFRSPDFYIKNSVFYSNEITLFFKGSLFSLRGPPVV
ncbi:hypothetical protein [Flavobacterium sp.]|uniref:hypothetical protein n=1 Tax=Flavobacterium sp. TaxID=239 RepID=UPI002B4B78A0|nr:hypothetical protein [Flavobacterium sp.]HLP65836.1 hypothetical protein [Flavobacterium sp.]